MKTVNLMRFGYLLLVIGFIFICSTLSACGIRYKTTHKHHTHYPAHEIQHIYTVPGW